MPSISLNHDDTRAAVAMRKWNVNTVNKDSSTCNAIENTRPTFAGILEFSLIRTLLIGHELWLQRKPGKVGGQPCTLRLRVYA